MLEFAAFHVTSLRRVPLWATVRMRERSTLRRAQFITAKTAYWATRGVEAGLKDPGCARPNAFGGLPRTHGGNDLLQNGNSEKWLPPSVGRCYKIDLSGSSLLCGKEYCWKVHWKTTSTQRQIRGSFRRLIPG